MTGPGIGSRAAGAPVPAPAPSSSSSDLSGSTTSAATPPDLSSLTDVSDTTTYRQALKQIAVSLNLPQAQVAYREAWGTDCLSEARRSGHTTPVATPAAASA